MMFFHSLLPQIEKNFNTSLLTSKNLFRWQTQYLRNYSFYNSKMCMTKFNTSSFMFPQNYLFKSFARSSTLTPYTHSFGFAPVRFNSIFSRIGRFLSPKPATTEVAPSAERISLTKRMKLAYKTYGKPLIFVHIVTTGMWIASAYLLLAYGFDLKGLLERVHASPRVVGPIEKAMSSPWGTLAAAYLVCKLISPLRYLVTLVGTHYIVKTFVRRGVMPPVSEEARPGKLARDIGKYGGQQLTRRVRERKQLLAARVRERQLRRRREIRDQVLALRTRLVSQLRHGLRSGLQRLRRRPAPHSPTKR